MDVIEIDSSDGEDDIEFGWDSPDRSSNNGRDWNHGLETNFENYHRKNEKAPRPESSKSNRPWNEVSNANGANSSRSNGRGETDHTYQEMDTNFPHVNGDGEVTFWTSNGSDATYTSLGADSKIPTQHTQRRTLPSSFQSFTSKPSFERCSRPHVRPAHGQQQEPGQFKFNNSSSLDMHNMVNYRSKFDNELPQHPQKRILPPSLHQTMHKTASEGQMDYKGRKNVATEHETFDKCRVPPSSSMNDDVLIYKTSGTHRVLPPTLINGKSVDNPRLIGSSDAGNRSGLGEHKLVEHDERAIYQEALQNLGQPKLEDDLPDGLLSISLLKHQKIALAWMVQKEKSVHCAGGILADDQGLGKTVSMIALIQKQRSQQSKFTSNDSQQIKPEALCLDDDDDNGVTELAKEIQVGKVDLEKKPDPISSTSMHTSGNLRPAAGTLVVCPASILRQWARELDEKVTSSAKLSVLVYHGGTRTKDPAELAKYDVVLTTYAIVTNEVPKQSNAVAADDDGEQRNLDNYEISSEFASKKRKDTTNARSKGKKKAKKLKDSQFDYDCGPLARVRWFRVILDEAQSIKNYRTQVARACSGLRAKRRWCLSGTPIQNSIDDLYSYFRFLKYDPYAVYSSFCNSIKFPISKNASHGYKKLQAVLKTVLLRRTKDTLLNGEPIINLPPKSIFLKKADFSPEERLFYVNLEAESRQQFKKYAAAGTVQQNYASILLLLLRLRQACDHPVLVKGHQSDTVGKDSLDMARKLPKDMQFNLLYQLEGSLAICCVCNDPPEDAVVTMCGHVFCYQCVSDRITGDDNLCPSPGCKDTLGRESVFSRSTLQSCISDQRDNIASSSGLTHYDEASVVQSNYVSSKIKAAVEILNSLSSPGYSAGSNECNGNDGPNQESPDKAIVFSQWTGMLDLLEYSLNQSLIQYRRLDGSMSLASRDKSVKEFNTDPEVTVMIMSLKAGNLGLNMVAACHVILLDLWWNPTTEDQAIDRAHRIGQTRPVTVSRLTIKDTVEDRILALQEEKRKMVASAFGEDQAGGHATKLTVEDLRYLFMV